ncbi:OmpA family protein [Aurantiacibacter sediminis]|uniref:OmpA family protein n=1 Tax=Aurantiacibacter sediminis TaxID=2793064 RepID=A0ABS0N0K5_9SPHN|nr:OmpA family protein [Aurantiacibacter sediminis]MBH5321501.1 OmpA family protein [Aurantiacibacter sediminis]
MTFRTARPLTSALALTLGALALSACEVRRDGAEGDPAAEPSAEPDASEGTAAGTPTQTPTPTQTASIIREDLATEAPEVAEPAEPISVIIPMPDGAEVNAAAQRVLVNVLSSDAMDENWPITLSGHTDSSGNDQANLRASRARAEAVAAWLVEYGVEDDRIEVIAFGEQNPVAPNALPDGTENERGRQRNRRVELRIAPPARPNASSTPRPARTPAN